MIQGITSDYGDVISGFYRRYLISSNYLSSFSIFKFIFLCPLEITANFWQLSVKLQSAQDQKPFFWQHFLILHQGLPPPPRQPFGQRSIAKPSRAFLNGSYSPKNGISVQKFFSFAARSSLLKFLAASDTVNLKLKHSAQLRPQ